ncbi:iron chelate uptake ABC transporter family permease subunit [Seleniivibrio woodruffii]|uniref:Iron complex transport system permease protein n=1 Tax=Seleniivibrio woodruffii TaxID=1078050 RepID=A0A4R1KBU1_9BACT|nr:iron chelate uptake ABC transporter family permease subunit [Seleniivibrio woodruffii]TCK61996.1 iron complex transport system permease protein [Seleniivibrio woodruffii]TVZ34887.1 iron complex transport system permease protein [Seleniivibrio woodruffii]
MRDNVKLVLLSVLSAACILLFLFYDSGSDLSFILPERGAKAGAMVITGIAVAYSAVIFQTISFNRILTPSVMGFDAVYLFLQTTALFIFGSGGFMMVNEVFNFGISAAALMLFTFFLYRLIFVRNGNVFFLMLVGVVMWTLFRSLTVFMQMLIDPNEFAVVQDAMFASFNNVRVDLLGVSAAVIIAVALYCIPMFRKLDVMLLGREHAVSLGIAYDNLVKRSLIVITLLVAVSTALVGQMTFLGIIVSNLAYESMKTYKHSYVIACSALYSVIAIVGGQFVIERVFYFNITVSVVINFVGGLYFMYLLTKESK